MVWPLLCTILSSTVGVVSIASHSGNTIILVELMKTYMHSVDCSREVLTGHFDGCVPTNKYSAGESNCRYILFDLRGPSGSALHCISGSRIAPLLEMEAPTFIPPPLHHLEHH